MRLESKDGARLRAVLGEIDKVLGGSGGGK